MMLPIQSASLERVPGDEVFIWRKDYEDLMSLINISSFREAFDLDDELQRAAVLETRPADTVAMYSRVLVRDCGAGRDFEVTIVFPHEASVAENLISVFSPVGSALLGLREGGQIKWRMPNEKLLHLRVMSILDDDGPEAA